MSKVGRLEGYLKQVLGYVETSSPSRKYRKFVNGAATPLWLGRRGAVRAGETISGSVSVNPTAMMVLWEKTNNQ
jgi:hypothetical protein